MQLYALDLNKKLVSASHAMRQQDYYCLECHQVVRCRGGAHYQTHYYHLTQSRTCRLSGKSMIHLQVQFFLQSLFPEGECQLEYRFPVINRIADVVWLPQKLIFEIQCSPITAAEVKERNEDYYSQGFQVIWILDDRRYNQWKISAAEKYLQGLSPRGCPYYFTNMDAEGKGMIYDQYDLVQKGIRQVSFAPLPVDMRQPRRLSNDCSACKTLPKWISSRISCWPLYFAGDLLDLSHITPWSSHFAEYLERALAAEASVSVHCDSTAISLFKKLFFAYIVRPYRIFFQILLERACR